MKGPGIRFTWAPYSDYIIRVIRQVIPACRIHRCFSGLRTLQVHFREWPSASPVPVWDSSPESGSFGACPIRCSLIFLDRQDIIAAVPDSLRGSRSLLPTASEAAKQSWRPGQANSFGMPVSSLDFSSPRTAADGFPIKVQALMSLQGFGGFHRKIPLDAP